MTKRLAIVGLQPDSKYRVQVRAKIPGEQTEWSQALDFSTIKDTNAPLVPQNVAVSPVGTSFLLKWSSIDQTGAVVENNDFAYYEVTVNHVASSKSVQYTVPSSTDPRFDFTIEMNESAFGTPKSQLQFSIKSVDTSGNKSNPSAIVTGTNAAPQPPASLTATGLVEAIALDWAPSPDTDVVAYNVYVGTVSGFTPGAGNFVSRIEGLSYVYSTLTTSARYVKISAIDIFGTESTTFVTATATAKTALISDTTAPNAPTNVTTTSGYDTGRSQAYIDTSWVASTSNDVRNYTIRYLVAGSSNFNYVTVNNDVTTARLDVVAGSSYNISVQAIDFTGNKSAWVNSSTYPQSVPKDTTGPSQPAAPSVSGGVQTLFVSHTGNKSAGGQPLESDWARLEVYASKTNDFSTFNNTTLIGSLDKSNVIAGTFPVGTGTWYVKVIAVDYSGNPSAPSIQASATVATIGTVDISNDAITAPKVGANEIITNSANIKDAVIVDAKIKSLDADKLKAGTAIVTNLKLADGQDPDTGAAVTGSISSSNYEAGVSGMKLDKAGLEINDGVIQAKALRLQQGQNIAPPAYANFEFVPSYYQGALAVDGGAMIWAINPASKFGSQSLGTLWGTNTVNPKIYMSPSLTDYNIDVIGGKDYIFSVYTWVAGSVTTNVQMLVKWDTGTTTLVQSQDIAAGTSPATAVRLKNALTAPSTATKALIYFESSTLTDQAGFNIDGIQVEPKLTSETAPSQWTPSSMTVIDGGQVKTGTIIADRVDAKIARMDEVRAGFVLAGKISVGNSYWTPTEGIVIPQPDGGTITLPADGITPATITANLVAKSLTVEKNLNVAGMNNKVTGQITLSNGITRPTVAPSLSQFYPSMPVLDTVFLGPISYGAIPHLETPNEIVYVNAFYGAGIGIFHKDTGAPGIGLGGNDRPWFSNFNPTGGITSLGSGATGNYYVLGYDNNRNNNWYVYRLDNTFNKLSELFVAYSSNVINRPAIGNDGLNIMIALNAGSNAQIIRKGPTLGAVTAGRPATQLLAMPSLTNYPLNFIGEDVYDYGSSRIILGVGNGNSFFPFTPNPSASTLTRNVPEVFASADGGNVRGMFFTSGVFKSHDTNGRVATYSSYRTSTTVNASYTWYDSVGTIRETQDSPISTYTLAARSWIKFESPTPPDNGVLDANNDKANRVGVYMSTGASVATRLQTYLSVDGSTGVAVRQFSTGVVTTGGQVAPTVNGFIGVPGASIGLISAASGGTVINGDSTGLLGPIAFTSTTATVSDPIMPTDVANKRYTDSAIANQAMNLTLVPSGATALTGTANQQVAGAVGTFNVTSVNDVFLVTGMVDMQITTGNAVVCRAFLGLDGTVASPVTISRQAVAQQGGNLGGRWTTPLVWSFTGLSPGEHTARLLASMTGGTSGWSIQTQTHVQITRVS